jgi:hypothetical protein
MEILASEFPGWKPAVSHPNVPDGPDLRMIFRVACPWKPADREDKTKEFQEETMKKFWIVVLALGLVAGFALSASAAGVKFSGSYYVEGMYADKPLMNADQKTTTGAPGAQSLYAQRLRVQTEFKVAEGLSLVTRFDALERRWGDSRWAGTGDAYNRTMSPASATTQIQENIEFERAYLDFTTKIGRFNIGYQRIIAWGTVFMDTDVTRALIKYFIPVGPLTVVAAIEKGTSGDSNVGYGSATTGIGTASDADYNVYDLGAVYKWSAGDAGVIYQKIINKTTRLTANRYTDLNFFMPYAKMKFGKLYVEGEALAGFGDLYKYDDTGIAAGGKNITAQQYALYLHAKADIDPAYAGGRFVYISGDDPKTTDKVEGSLMTSQLLNDLFNPCLIMWNNEYTKWIGNVQSSASALGANPFTGTAGGMTTYMDNAWFYQIYGGFKPTPKLDIMASIAYAYADKKPYSGWTTTGGGTEFLSDAYGTEIDVTATYKIFDNLEYMAGGGYMMTGDFFKGASTTFNKADNYLLMHRLTMTF